MICRGFSLQIMTDIYLNGALSVDEVIAKYGDGRGMDWMLQKRIASIEKLNMVCFENGQLQLRSNLGHLVGWGGICFKKILNMGEGG